MTAILSFKGIANARNWDIEHFGSGRRSRRAWVGIMKLSSVAVIVVVSKHAAIQHFFNIEIPTRFLRCAFNPWASPCMWPRIAVMLLAFEEISGLSHGLSNFEESVISSNLSHVTRLEGSVVSVQYARISTIAQQIPMRRLSRCGGIISYEWAGASEVTTEVYTEPEIARRCCRGRIPRGGYWYRSIPVLPVWLLRWVKP